MKLITTSEILRTYMPNTFDDANGEVDLFSKLSPQLELAEDWVRVNLTSEASFNAISGYSDSNTTKTITAQLVVAIALVNAIPSLDLVLTPNGFGVVSSSAIAPASRERVGRLIDSLHAIKDDCTARLLELLPGVSKWLASSQAGFFRATLFPDMGILASLELPRTYDNYIALRHRLIHIEGSLAEEYFSYELMDALRAEQFAFTSSARKSIAEDMRSEIISFLRKECFSMQHLMRIVNTIRADAKAFPEWHNSETAQLFTPPIFENKKQSNGYFF